MIPTPWPASIHIIAVARFGAYLIPANETPIFLKVFLESSAPALLSSGEIEINISFARSQGSILAFFPES